MFHRRKRAQSNPHFNVNGSGADSAATSAAALAFLSTQKSNANLAAAAAGAALRSRPTTPTNVAEVQTKRTQRRSASVSSSRSASVNGRPSSMLERRLSSGSMTERIGTFREQSPNRGAARPAARDAPPVPNIPASYSPTIGHGRSSSVQPTMRVSSPPPTATGRGSSLQPAPKTTMRRNQAPAAPERTDSRGSVNFSYPTILQRRISDGDDDRAPERLLTPIRPAIDLNEMVYDSNTRSFRSRGDLMLYEQRLRDAAQAQVPPKRKKSVRKEGSHLAQGSVGGRMKVAPHATEERRPVEQPHQQEEEHLLPRTLRQRPPFTDSVMDVSPRQEHIPQQMSPRKQRQTDSRASQRSNTASDNDSDASEQRKKASRKTLSHQPSVVREVAEPEDAEDKAEKVLSNQVALRHAGHQDIQETVYANTPTPATRRRHGSVDSPAPVVIPESNYSTMVPQNLEKIVVLHDDIYDSKAEAESAKAAARHEDAARGASISPSRKPGPQFLSPTDPVANIRHNPAARSISPMKSALKHSSSRGPSPLGENPEGWTTGHGSADLSDASTNISESKPMRKKSVRVSFDEGSNVVVADPEIERAGMRRIWSGGNHNFRNRSNSPMSEESEGMGPRPSLPVFGSVRKEKREHVVKVDRPLVVKPHETSATSSVDAGSERTFGPSSDHMVGAVLAQGFAGKTMANASNISKSREPSPPVVTSREDSGFQSGYQSDSDESSESVQIVQAVTVETQEAQREALRTPDGQRKPRFVEDVSPKAETPTKEKAAVLFAQDNAGGTTPGSYRSPSEGETPLFTPPEDEDMLMLTKKAAAVAITRGTPPHLVVTVPTPIAEQEEWRPSMPGGLASWDSPTSTPIEEQTEMSLSQYMVVQDATPAAVGIAEPQVVSHAPGAPHVGEIAAQAEDVLIHDRERAERPRSTSAHSNRTEEESVYSDAAEHLTDTEGDGFMSLDAVVDSPTSPTIKERFVAPAPHSPIRTTHSPTRNAAQVQKEEADVDWIKTQLYWSSLSDEKKRQLEAEARKLAEEDGDDSSSRDEMPVYTKQKKKQPGSREALKPSPPPKMAPLKMQEDDLIPSPDRTYQIAPGTKGPSNGAPASPAAPLTMRQSLRAPKPAVLESGRMRSSLRGPPPAQVRERPASSSQYAAPKQSYYQAGSGSLNANSRHSTQPPAAVAAKSTPREQAIALVQAQQIAMQRMQEQKLQQKPALRRRGSADSDSSFRRERSGGNGFFAKSSMRGNGQAGERAISVGGPPQGDRGRRFSVRSLSPVGRKGMGGGVVQAPSATAGLTTLRGNRPAAQRMVPSVQGSPKSSGGFFGRKKAKPVAVSGGFAKSSRFADSDSDEDAPRPQRFSSRFADSSDEDEPPAPMPPVSMKTRSFRGRGASALNSERPKSAIELGTGVGGRPANPRKPSKVLEEDSSDLEDIDDEQTREKTRLNSIQGVEAQAAQKGVHPEAVRLAQAYFGAGLLNTTDKHSATGISTAESTPVRQRNVTPPTPGFTNTSQTSLSPGRTTVPPPNFQKDKKAASPEQKKKGGFMSILSRKRKDKNDKVGKHFSGDSGARQGTPLERSRLDLESARCLEDPPMPGGLAGPGGKLKKKGAPQLESVGSGGRPAYGRLTSGSFRAEVSRSSEIEQRPQTSDGPIAYALTKGPIDGIENTPFHRPTHDTTAGPIDGVESKPLFGNGPTHETTSGPIDGIESSPIITRAEHETTSGLLDGLPAGKERPSVLSRGTSASAVTFGVEGKKKEKKRGFLKRLFDL